MDLNASVEQKQKVNIINQDSKIHHKTGILFLTIILFGLGIMYLGLYYEEFTIVEGLFEKIRTKIFDRI